MYIALEIGDFSSDILQVRSSFVSKKYYIDCYWNQFMSLSLKKNLHPTFYLVFIVLQHTLFRCRFCRDICSRKIRSSFNAARIRFDLSTLMLATLPIISWTSHLYRRSALFQLHSAVTLELLILLHYGFSSFDPSARFKFRSDVTRI